MPATGLNTPKKGVKVRNNAKLESTKMTHIQSSLFESGLVFGLA